MGIESKGECCRTCLPEAHTRNSRGNQENKEIPAILAKYIFIKD